jgi:hypothetical protein
MVSTVPFAAIAIVVTMVTMVTFSLGCFRYADAFEVLRSAEDSCLAFVLIPLFRCFYQVIQMGYDITNSYVGGRLGRSEAIVNVHIGNPTVYRY